MVIKPPFQPASQGARGSNGNSFTHKSKTAFTSENCNPNMDKEAVTPKKPTKKKTPVKATALRETELGKLSVWRRLDCELSPSKSPHKHFCRSPRCAANNPDYAVPTPRHHLKSKRHLLAGWQAPLNFKLLISACNSNHHEGLEGEEGENGGCRNDEEHAISECTEQEVVLQMKPSNLVEEDVKEMTSKGSTNQETAVLHMKVDHVKESDVLMNMSKCSATTQEAVKMALLDAKESGVMKTISECTTAREAISQMNVPNPVKEINSTCCSIEVAFPHLKLVNLAVEDDVKESEVKTSKCTIQELPQTKVASLDVKEDVKEQVSSLQPVNSVSESKDFDTSMRGMSASTSSVGDMSLESTEVIIGRVPRTSEESRMNPVRLSKNTGSNFFMGSDSRRLSSRPPRRYIRKLGRRLSTVSNHSISLHKQDGLKRKKAGEWMWDTAIKEAVQRLAPRVPWSVNALVKAFESVKLTEKEIQRASVKNMYKNASVGRLVLKDSPFGCGASEPDVETIASIRKVQAWDESMASVDLVDEVNGEKAEENMPVTPVKSKFRIPPLSSKSEPPKVQSSRWATASDVIMTARGDTFSDKRASSISGKSRTTEWTCVRKSQAGRPLKQKLKRCTSLHPFRLRTEERGAMKEYVFSKRLQQMWEEERRLRIPLAQGLPWTTEEPAVPLKPPVKEQTRPERFKLVTDVRAVERAEFDEYISERQKQEELQKLEEERQRQIAEEEEVRRLRREMVPRAQLMPYFDRPFMPHRSSKKLTVPREPKFHLKQSKRPRCMASCSSSAT